MENNLLCVSPIDGRYHEYTACLIDYFSEFALFKYRLLFEIGYFLHLKDIGLKELQNITNADCLIIRSIYESFTIEDCITIKNIEKKIKHDVKAVEYFIQKKFDILGLTQYKSFIHFALTSQDINNNSLTLSIKECVEDLIIPLLEIILQNLLDKSKLWENITMISRTHGQPAVPTTLGKEIKVFHYRIKKQLELLKNITYYGKLGGASGNLNAHYAAYPDYKWDKLLGEFLESFSLKRNKYTTQIDNYENLSVVFDNLKRINTIFIDMNKDIWHYISINYIVQKFDNNEVGSSTMPHKINPINFENSEGNLLLANSLLNFMSEKLPISRLQRDLTDSTVTRNIGSIFGHILIAYENFKNGFQKLDANALLIKEDLHDNCVVIIEGIQVILKKYGISNSYELCKDLTRNNELITMNEIRNFIKNLNVDEHIKDELYRINVENY